MRRAGLQVMMFAFAAVWVPGVLLAPPATAQCVGDCDGSGDVTVNELITMVNIALNLQPLSACVAGDADSSGDITVNEIIAGVNNALSQCTAPGNAWDLENPSPVGDDLFGVSFVNAQQGWAVGGFGDIVHTMDGGVNWDIQIVDTSVDLFSVKFV